MKLSIKDKQDENRNLHRLTVALMKLSDKYLIEKLEIEEELKEVILHGWGISDFRGKRRQERVIVGQLREADTEDIDRLMELADDPQKAKDALEEEIAEIYQELINGDSFYFQEFVEEYQVREMQRLRQLIRNAKKAEGTKKTAPKRDLLDAISQLVFGE